MSTPNNPFGTSGNNQPEDTGYGTYGEGQGPGDTQGLGYGAGAYPGSSPYGEGQQDQYGYGGFENSPLNSTKQNKLATWALGLGIASIALWLVAIIPFLALLFFALPFIAVAGVIVSIVAMVKARGISGPGRRLGQAVTGLILSILSLVVMAGLAILIVVVLNDSGFMDCLNLPTPAQQQECMEQVFVSES